ncbi:dihydrofolate reductase family protein [Natrinema marinum]|uniref:dihydrofolate reductase family protein n=1 Tax=Natrinema marinum TaxID=2961598 RepID=UPI0020C8467B|nr:dihydrofolate reductase family protein [Natrinema marinum]
MTTGEITLYIATSVDGFIAAEDGSVAWLEEFQPEAGTDDRDGSYETFFADIDALVMGATTYEQVRAFGDWPYEERPTYVLTHGEHPRATDAVEFVDGEVAALATELERRHDRIWLVGGAQVVRAFLREDRVDELRLTLVPVLLGRGISLFGTDGKQRTLELLENTTRETGMVELRYAVSG